MTRLYLIRHAHPSAGWGDDPDPGLDEAGAVQAQAARDALMALPLEERPTKVMSSPLRRCLETAAPFAEAIGAQVRIEPAIGEIPTPRDLSPAERPAWLRAAMGGTWKEIEGDIDYDHWRRQVAASLARAPATAVFSHFVAINAVLSVLADDPRVLLFRPGHAAINVLELVEGRLVLVARGAEGVTQVL